MVAATTGRDVPEVHRGRGDHAGHGRGGIGQDPRGDRVEPGHVGDRRHQRHVADVDVGGRVARRPSSTPPAWAPRRAAPASPRSRSRCCPTRPRRAHPDSAPRRTAGGRRRSGAAHIASRPPRGRSARRGRTRPRRPPPRAARRARRAAPPGCRRRPAGWRPRRARSRVAEERVLRHPWCPACRRGRRSGDSWALLTSRSVRPGARNGRYVGGPRGRPPPVPVRRRSLTWPRSYGDIPNRLSVTPQRARRVRCVGWPHRQQRPAARLPASGCRWPRRPPCWWAALGLLGVLWQAFEAGFGTEGNVPDVHPHHAQRAHPRRACTSSAPAGSP